MLGWLRRLRAPMTIAPDGSPFGRTAAYITSPNHGHEGETVRFPDRLTPTRISPFRP